ncbi:hypothetical protein EYF80_034434 [Liparis tanakae]|uniref:Uncharacterized protein n=1 Tax=Liparis tanakae TaxID=230148 RepID=A0A4Z2GQ01_9TELE|nr:hypothetical protein EYF80_034434 [Liparis tanakae]
MLTSGVGRQKRVVPTALYSMAKSTRGWSPSPESLHLAAPLIFHSSCAPMQKLFTLMPEKKMFVNSCLRDGGRLAQSSGGQQVFRNPKGVDS